MPGMRKSILFSLAITILVACKSTLNVHDFKAENIPNYENISTVDSALIRFIEPYRAQVDRDMQEVIAETTVDLVKRKPESLLTNYLADILLSEGQLYASGLQQKPIPEVAYLNYGGIRADIPKGKITVGKIFETMPFENEMVFVKISGNDLRLVGEAIAQKGGDGVAGMRVRTSNGKLISMEIGNRQLDENAEYWMVTNDYVAAGGDNMTMLTNRRSIIITGIKLRDCFIERMRRDYDAGRLISPKLDGRITNE